MNGYEKTAPRAGVSAFMAGVYGWMTAALAVTAATAAAVLADPAVLSLLLTRTAEGLSLSGVWWGLTVAELVLVIVLSAKAGTMRGPVAGALLMLYAASTGATISPVVSLYTGQSVAGTLLLSAGMFGALSLFGLATKRDLSPWGSFLFMGLVGVLLLSVVNMFLGSAGLHFAVGAAGIVVFAGLTAYDTAKLKTMSGSGGSAVAGALCLYLDFINIFLFLLRFLGNRR